MLGSILGTIRAARTRRRQAGSPPPPRRRVRPQIELLERRDAPSCTASIIGTSPNRVLTVNCTAGPEVVTVNHVSGTNPQAIINSINPPMSWTFPDSAYDSILVNGGSGGLTTNIQANVKPLDQQGFDVVNVGDNGSMTRIEGPVTLYNSSASTTLNLDDSADPGNRNVTITAKRITGLSPAAINTTASSIGNLNIQGGHGIDLTTVLDTPATFAMTLNTGDGLNTLDVLGASVSSTFNGDGPVTATVGQVGRVQNINGPLQFTNRIGLGTALLVDDSADPIYRTVTMDVNASWGSITGLAPAVISYSVAAYPQMRSVTVRGGLEKNAFYILENADFIPTTVESGGEDNAFYVAATSAEGNLILNLAGKDYVDIGYSTGTLAPILNAVTVNGSGFGNGDTVVLDDSSNVGSESYYCYNNSLDTSTRTVLVFNNIDYLWLNHSTGSGTNVNNYHTDPFWFCC